MAATFRATGGMPEGSRVTLPAAVRALRGLHQRRPATAGPDFAVGGARSSSTAHCARGPSRLLALAVDLPRGRGHLPPERQRRRRLPGGGPPGRGERASLSNSQSLVHRADRETGSASTSAIVHVHLPARRDDAEAVARGGKRRQLAPAPELDVEPEEHSGWSLVVVSPPAATTRRPIAAAPVPPRFPGTGGSLCQRLAPGTYDSTRSRLVSAPALRPPIA